MIGFFPTLFPDETLYNGVARYIDVLNPKRSVTPIIKNLFGLQISWPITGIPVSTSNLISNLPNGHKLTIEKVLSDHSLVPYYEPFLPIKYVQKLINSNKPIPLPKLMSEKHTLKYCPTCAETDKNIFGEPYWHRVHQVPGVLVCPNHKVFLIDTNLPSTGYIQFISLSKYLSQYSTTEDGAAEKCNDFNLINIAQDSLWLLQNHQPGREIPEQLPDEIKLLFYNSAWLSGTSSSIRKKEFTKAFIEHYSSDFLDKINCSLSRVNWLNPMTEHRADQYVINPLHCLLVFRFFGQTAESFFTSEKLRPPAKNPFGTSPWFCLNRVSGHYMDGTIKSVNYDKKMKDPVGKFECPICGYTYKYRASNTDNVIVIKYGPVWEKYLLKMADDPSITINDIKLKFSIAKTTINRHLKELKNRTNDDVDIHQAKLSLKRLKSQEKLRPKHRHIIQNILDNNPNISITELTKLGRGSYNWLAKNDRQWLIEHKPLSKRYLKTDWEAQDQKRLQLAKEAVSVLLNNPEPIMLTKASIIREMGLNHKNYNLHITPNTKEYIESAVESREDFLVRYIEWTAQQYIVEGTIPLRSQLYKRANIKEYDWGHRIGDTVDKILQAISESNSCLMEAAAGLSISSEPDQF